MTKNTMQYLLENPICAQDMNKRRMVGGKHLADVGQANLVQLPAGGKEAVKDHKVGISLDLVLGRIVQPRQHQVQKRLLRLQTAQMLKLGDPDGFPPRGGHGQGDVVFELLRIRFDGAVVGATVPVHGHEVDSAAGACVEEVAEVCQSHAVNDSVRDARGAQLPTGTGVFVHVLAVRSHGGANVHESLAARLIGFVQRHQILGTPRFGLLHVGIPVRERVRGEIG